MSSNKVEAVPPCPQSLETVERGKRLLPISPRFALVPMLRQVVFALIPKLPYQGREETVEEAGGSLLVKSCCMYKIFDPCT